MLNRVIKSRAAAATAASAARAYLHLVDKTSSRTIVEREHFDRALSAGRGVILAFWHGRLAMTPFIRRETTAPVSMLVSRHRDGEIIANAAGGFGVEFIRGSSANPKKPKKHKDGAPAIMEILSALEQNGVVGVTPDGPRGPREEVQAGIIRLAAMAGAPILPAGVSAKRAMRFNTWDRLHAPTPWCRLIYVAGAPITPPPDLSMDQLQEVRGRLRDSLCAVTARADALAAA